MAGKAASTAPVVGSAAVPPAPSHRPGGRSASATASRPRPRPGVATQALMKFLFPPNLEHPESTGRLELFARYGPVDEEGRLRGGIGGSHVHTDLELRQMISHNTREALFSLFSKPRDTVEVIVDTLMPLALDQNYTEDEVRSLLRAVPEDADGRLSFPAVQDVALANQRRRLQALVKDGVARREKGPRVPYQTKSAAALMAVTRKKKMNPAEEQMNMQKRLGNYCTLVAGLEDQNNADQIARNVILCRDLGSVHDRWDRYCALRRKGRGTYIQARNTERGPACMDDGLADKRPGVSSLTSALAF